MTTGLLVLQFQTILAVADQVVASYGQPTIGILQQTGRRFQSVRVLPHRYLGSCTGAVSSQSRRTQNSKKRSLPGRNISRPGIVDNRKFLVRPCLSRNHACNFVDDIVIRIVLVLQVQLMLLLYQSKHVRPVVSRCGYVRHPHSRRQILTRVVQANLSRSRRLDRLSVERVVEETYASSWNSLLTLRARWPRCSGWPICSRRASSTRHVGDLNYRTRLFDNLDYVRCARCVNFNYAHGVTSGVTVITPRTQVVVITPSVTSTS